MVVKDGRTPERERACGKRGFRAESKDGLGGREQKRLWRVFRAKGTAGESVLAPICPGRLRGRGGAWGAVRTAPHPR